MVEKVKPVLIEVEDDLLDPTTAPPVPEPELPQATGQAMQGVITFASRNPSRLSKWFWRLLATVLTFGLSLWTWNWITQLIANTPILGYAATVLIGLFLLVCFLILGRELAGFSRLRRIDRLRHSAEAALTSDDLATAKSVQGQLVNLYRSRKELDWHRAKLSELTEDQFDADTLLNLTEAELLAPLDRIAVTRIEAASRQVATATALVPLAFADVAVALTTNIRMIRQIAEIYGGRTGALGNLRLTRAVLAHLVATGAVAVGDDLLGSVAGGSVLSKLSRRFGEGIINGALTARVGIAAMDVCRPMPFKTSKRPSVSGVVGRALAGLFGR